MNRNTTLVSLSVSLVGLSALSAAAAFAAASDLSADLSAGDSPFGAALPGVRQEEAPVKDAAPKEEEAPQLKGRVVFKGELPAVKPLNVPAKAAAGCCPDGENVNSDDLSLQISKDRGIKNVVVTATVKGAKVEIPKEPYIVDQKGCRFLPHVQVVPKGATVAFLNSDETSHNVHLWCMLNDSLNQTVTAGKKLERVFSEAESIKVACDMHTWMKSYVVVTDATHFTMTDADGAFSMKGLPPGEHTLHFWHETLGGSKEATVTVAEDGTVSEALEVELEKKKKKKRGRRR